MTSLPYDAPATSWLQVVDDCRAVAALLGGDVLLLDDAPELVIDLVVPAQRPLAVRVPRARQPLSYLPAGYGDLPAEITDHLLVTAVGGLEDPAEL